MERWAPYKELWSSVQDIVLQRNNRFHHFKSLLRKHKPDFLNLLKNPVKNSEHRSKVQKANSEAIVLKGDTTPQLFSNDFINEALIISDLFNLNELSAAELLLEGERQLPHYPQLTRGLVAVLLYWDVRKCLTGTLKTLIQCRRGSTWTLEVPDETVEFLTNFTDELLEHGMSKQILKLVNDIQVEKEVELLAKQRGLGGPEHRKQVRDLISGVRQDLSECLFNFAGQSNLPLKDTMSILDHLENVESSADEKLTLANITLLHAVFYAFAFPQDVAVQHDEEAVQLLLKHPLLAEKDFVQTIHKRLMKRDDWKTPGLKASVQLSWALSLRSIAQIPMGLMEAMPDTFNSPSFTEALEQDEAILDSALAGNVFQFLKENIVSRLDFQSEEFFVRRMHGLLTDLIVNMPLKVKEMKNRGDEVARIILLHVMQREEPPILREDFKHLIELITELYEHDETDLQLSVEFWCPASDAFQNGPYLATRRHQRLPQRQISLFKFLRQSGDMLPPLLYIPYLKMLAALSNGPYSARMAFEMLRANGSHSGGVSDGSTVSWDHFFSSIHQYYNNLKHDPSYHDQHNKFIQNLGGIGGQTLPQTAHHQMTITPQEVEGLRAVLQLLARIVEYDDTACLAVHEHPTWNACNGLLGLLQYHIPALLKGDILLALNQLARIREISVGLLQAMESIVEISPHAAAVPTQRSIAMELEDVEAREEQYHMTSAFLKLTATLFDANSLVNLISGGQSVGFQSYLRFAVDHVFLKFMSRSYKRVEEKYEVATNALKIFIKLLEQYVPHVEHFTADKKPIESSFSRLAGSLSQTSMNFSFNSTQGQVNFFTQPSSKPPGYLLLLHIMNEGNFFKTIMEIVENCIAYLDRFHTDVVLEKHLITAGLLSLQLIQVTLNLQDSFLSCMRESGSPVLVNTLDKLLLGINPRTSKADYIVTITKYVCHNATHPELSLCANEIISCLCRMSNSTQREVYSMLSSMTDGKTRQRILHGFVEAIESPQPEVDEDLDKEYDPVDVYHSRCRLTILRLLLLCVDLPSPNLTHFLLGFNLTKPISKASLQDAGVMGSPRTCLHSILSILSFGPEVAKKGVPAQPTAVTETPAMAELCYQFVYRLAANVDTTGPVLRYLRSSHDFVYRHLQHLPFKSGGIAKENQLLLQQSWLLQTTAIELFSTASNRQRSHTQRLIQMLFEKQVASSSSSVLGTSVLPSATSSTSAFPGLSTTTAASGLGIEMSMTSMTTMSSTTMNNSIQQRHDLPQILSILEELDFIQEFPEPLTLNEFVLANVETALHSCEKTNENGLVSCDLKALGDLLQSNVNALQGSEDIERRARANQDVETIIRTAVERNQTRQSIHSKLALLNAWRHTLEVSLSACPSDMMSKDTKQQILLDILQELMCRVLHSDAMAELTAPVAPICLTLVTHLRSCFASQSFGEGQRRSGLVSDISICRDLDLSQFIQGGPAAMIPSNVASSLQVIMKDIIEWLLQAGVQSQVRADLYASLLYYLQMCQKPKGDSDKCNDNNSLVGLQTLSADVYSKLSRDNIKLFRTYGDVLMELVCKDACDGHNICGILAFSVLDAIVRIDYEQTWLRFMVKKGYVSIIARSLTQEDDALQEALSPNSDAVRPLYIYEQKMAFISTVSQTQMGARAILDAGVLAKLSECSFLEMRPTINEANFDSFLPGLMSRYRQLLFPALKVCSSILATFGGSSHFEASSLVFEFLLSHADSIINPVLKLQPIPGDVQSLMELNFVTGILCQVAALDFSNETLSSTIPQPVLIELQAHQSRIQRQLISLLPHYCVNDRWLKDVERNNQNRDNAENPQEINLLVHEICANLLSYCTAIMRQKSHNLDVPILLFAPRLDEAVDTESMFRRDYPGITSQPSIGLLVHVLRNTVSKFTASMDLLSQHKRQLSDVTILTTQELKEITGSEDQKLSIPQRQSIAAIKLRNSIESQEKLLSSLHFIMENSLLLLWQHLDSFIVQASSGDSALEGILFRTKSAVGPKTSIRKLQDAQDVYEGHSPSVFQKSNSFTIGRDTVNELKRVLPTCLTDVFLVKLCDIEAQWNVKHNCIFMRPIVRRLQRIMRLHAS